jgi:hypothetical protein
MKRLILRVGREIWDVIIYALSKKEVDLILRILVVCGLIAVAFSSDRLAGATLCAVGIVLMKLNSARGLKNDRD